MVQIRIGFENKPFSYVTNSGALEGPYAPYYQEKHSILMGYGVNLSYVDIENVFCSENQTCTGWLQAQQMGKIDYWLNIVHSALGQIPSNLSIIPASKEYSCHLFHKSESKLSLDYSMFFSFIPALGPDFWLITFLLLVGLLLISRLALKGLSPVMKFLDIIWIQVEIILGQNFNRLLLKSYKSILAINALLIMFVTILVSCSLITGLVSKIDYVKLDTIDDIIKYDYKLLVYADCRYMKLSREVAERRTVPVAFQHGLVIERYRAITEDKYVLLGAKSAYDTFKAVGCGNFRIHEEKEPLHLSSPLHRYLAGRLINAKIAPLINKIIFRAAYAEIESQLIDNALMQKLRNHYSNISVAPPSCLEPKDETQAYAVPISLDYLSIPFVIFFVGLFLASIIFIIEQLLYRL